MEVKRATNKDGVVYRIIANHPYWGFPYEIEYRKVYLHDDGTPCSVWFPTAQPQKLYGKLEDAEVEFNKLIGYEN